MSYKIKVLCLVHVFKEQNFELIGQSRDYIRRTCEMVAINLRAGSLRYLLLF